MKFQIKENIEDGWLVAKLDDEMDKLGIENISAVSRIRNFNSGDIMCWDIRAIRGEFLGQQLKVKLQQYFPNRKILLSTPFGKLV